MSIVPTNLAASVANAQSVERPEIREKDRMTGSFVSIATVNELARDSNSNFETWSALLIEWLPSWANQS